MSDESNRYFYRLNLLDYVKSLCDIDEAINGWERVGRTFGFGDNFRVYVALHTDEAVEYIVEYSHLFDNPNKQLDLGYLKNTEELHAAKKLVDAIRLVTGIDGNNYQIEDCCLHEDWETVVTAAQDVINIFDPFYPYTYETVPQKTQQHESKEPASIGDMDDKGWLEADLCFNENDLRQNRELGMSKSQRDAYYRSKFEWQIGLAAIGVSIIIVPLLAILFIIGIFVDLPEWINLCTPLTAFVFAFGIIGWTRWRGQNKLANLTVTKTVGEICDPRSEWIEFWKKAMLSLQAETADVYMMVPRRYFNKGKRYHIYYVYEDKKILSAERINDGEAQL